MNSEAIEVCNRLARIFAEGPSTRRLLDIVLRNKQVQEQIQEYVKGSLGLSEEEGWSVLREMVGDRLGMVKEAATVGAKEEGRYVPREGESVLGAPGTSHHTIEDIMVDVALYQNTFVGPKSKPLLRATAAFFKWQGDQHPEIVRFRSRALHGNVLNIRDARRLIGSYAARFFPFEWFTDWGIPIVGHGATIVDGYDWGSHRRNLDHRVTVHVDPPGITERVRYAHPDTPVKDEDGSLLSTRCVMLQEGGSIVAPYAVRLPEYVDEARLIEDLVEVGCSPGIPQVGFEGGPVYVASLTLAGSVETPERPASVWPGSLIDNLYAVAAELTISYPWIERDAAAEFVLTGQPPVLGSLSVKLYSDGNESSDGGWRIVLDSLAWAPAEEVMSVYRQMQQRVIEGRNKLPDSKTFEVACFVWKQDRLNGYERLPWPELCERWNAKEPGMRFDQWRSFRACFKRGEAAVKELGFGY